MKKTMKYFALAITGAIIFSCGKEEAGEIVPAASDAQEQTSGETDNPVDPAIDGNLLTSFSVNFESLVDEAGTKVSVNLGTGATAIENGDEVLVCNDEGGNAVYVYDGTEFSAKSGETPVALSTAVSVYYPADEFELDGTAVKFVMPGGVEASGDLGAIAPMAGVIAGEAGAYNVTLYNLASLLKVSVTADVNINSVSLDYGSGVNYAEGAKFTVDASAKTLTAADASSETSVTVALGTPAATADVVFLLPTVEIANGLAVTANLADNHNGGADSFTISNAITDAPARKKISTMSFYAGLFSGGAGTDGDPYKIANARDFKYISKYCAEGYADGSIDAAGFLGAFYKQTADINFNNADLSAYMIGGASTPFTGTYNGKPESTQYTLSNFTISGSPSGNEGVAPFKAIDGAVLQNIAISGAEIAGGKFTAGLVGYAKGAGATIQNCSIESSTISDSGNDYGAAGLIGGIYGGTVTGCSGTDLTISTGVENKAYFGGIMTYINGTVTVSKCSLNGTTTVTNAQKFGGIIGQINNANVTITDCHNHSTINGSKNYNGGICGYAKLGTISYCTNDGAVNGLSSTAGIVAQLDGATVDHCTNSGTIHGSENYAAGIVAYHTKGNLTNSVNTGAISADGAYVGGIAGMLKSSANYGLIKGCRSNATLSGANDVAGIVGRVTWGIVMDCFAKGSATGGLDTGGIVGYAYSTDGNVAVFNCLASVNVTCTASGNQHSGGVIGRATCCAGRYVYIGNCAGLNNVVKATESDAVRFGAFTGFTNAEAGGGTTTPNRVRIWNSYTLVDDTHFQCANTGATADVGGFIGRMGAASDLGDCYYIIDGSKSTLTGSNYKNITQTTAAVIGGTGNISVNPTRQGLSLDNTFLNVLNRCTYASNGTTRLTAFNDYPMCDWTMTGANSEALSHPVPANLVALGEDFYE